MVISPERCKHVVWERQDILVVFQAVVFVTGPVQDLHALRTANLRSEFWMTLFLALAAACDNTFTVKY